MTEEIYKKVGRGGAGNFWTKKDLEEAEKVEKEELEAQKVSGSIAADLAPSPDFVRTGRGGAGNYIPPSGLPTVSKDLAQASKEGVQQARKAVDKAASEKSAYRGPSGRGGAGNFRLADEEEERRRVEEKEREEESIKNKVKIDVEGMMQPPPKAHAAPQSYYDSIV